MNSLEKIQKVFHVFQILSKIAMIFSFVTAGLALLGAVCGIVWQNGGIVVGMDADILLSLTEVGGLYEMIGALLADAVLVLTDGILSMLTYRYFKAEQADGTPFTASGADRMMKLGIQTIVFPIVGAVIAAVIYGCMNLTEVGDWSNGATVVTGIMLILGSMVFRYGAELEAKCS